MQCVDRTAVQWACRRVVDRLSCRVQRVDLHRRLGVRRPLEPRQQQQLLERAVQPHDAALRIRQSLACGAAQLTVCAGQAQHLQVRLDGGQRCSQFVRGVVGEAPLALDRSLHAQQQVADGVDQRLQLGRRVDVGQRRVGICAPVQQRRADPFDRPQATPDADPQQHQAARHGHAERHRRSERDLAQQAVSRIHAVGGGDAHLALLQHVGAPGFAAKDACAVAQRCTLQPGAGGGARERLDRHFAAHQADLAREAVARDHVQRRRGPADLEPLGRKTRNQAGHHARRSGQALVEGAAQLLAHVHEHPQRDDAPQQRQRHPDDGDQAQAQRHCFSSPASPNR